MDPHAKVPLLCIGGVSDGQMFAAYGPRMEQPRREELPENAVETLSVADVMPLLRDTYHREQLGFEGGHRIAFWRYSDLTAFQCVERVFRKYEDHK